MQIACNFTNTIFYNKNEIDLIESWKVKTS